MTAILTFARFGTRKNDPSQRWTRWNGSNPNHNTTMARATLPIPSLSDSDKERFFAKISAAPTATGCIEWTACRDKTGYGRFNVGGKSLLATRIAYFLYSGVDPGNLEVCHHCDNPGCCGQECLYLDTHKGNMGAMSKRGRSGPQSKPDRYPRGDKHGSRLHPESVPRGERHPHAKLSDAQCDYIRSSTLSRESLGRELGVSARHIWNIITGRQRKKPTQLLLT